MTSSENPGPSHQDTPPVAPGRTASGTDVAQDAKASGEKVAQDAKASGEKVAQTAREEVANVSSTVGEQARTLLHEASSEFGDQAGTQQHRLAEGLRSLSQEFGSMAEGSDDSGQATGLVRDASQRTQDLADWLEQHSPGDVLEEVRQFARRKPGTFIAVAAGVGLLAGRLTRGLADDGDQDRTGADEVAGTREPGAQPRTRPYSSPEAGMAGTPRSGSAAATPPAATPPAAAPPVAAPPVGAGQVDPGPMSGMGAGSADPYPAGGTGTAGHPDTAASPGADTSGLAGDQLPVHGEDPR